MNTAVQHIQCNSKDIGELKTQASKLIFLMEPTYIFYTGRILHLLLLIDELIR